ncbi:hypothetical protein [Afifella aestuarii]|nr:hypothetical protein [Afifella aestuarii]
MSDLPLWPPIAAVVFGFVGLFVFWVWGRRLDRREAELRHRHGPAE